MGIPVPSADPFYAPVDRPGRPGDLLRFREVDVKSGETCVAWQVVYVSTDSRDRPIAVSGTVLVPSAPWRGAGVRPILSYGVGVHGLGRDVAPSYLMRAGTEFEITMVESALARGWAVAVTDGEGLGMPGPHTYGAGRAGGHTMLDIVRAAPGLGAELTPGGPVLVWGYSEGGRNAAWAAELHPSYAPDLDVRAVAAGGVPSDLLAVAKAIDGGPFSGLGLAVLVGLAHAHQDPALEAVLSERGKQAAARAATLDVTGLIVDFPEPLHHHTVRAEPWDDPAWLTLLDREKNGRHRPGAPVYLYHVAGDLLVPTAQGRELFADYAALGAQVTWADVRAEEHLAGAFAGAPDAVEWLAERLG
ncbi:lipase family protein [Nonomuraea cavernae]|uniref:Lipase n=1 Tax=Nonomuraea cavernae TaxID=2045107 RepID=A0A918DKN6_9ACTN|nr:lipase family protein [Nonomuraea cavernae]MCA2187880.1 lipase family protein [Nonomuraea cavernae]GGO72133.1 lipase [Nonomuraea cavernae]